MNSIVIFKGNNRINLPFTGNISIEHISDQFDMENNGGTFSLPIDVPGTDALRVFLEWPENLANPAVERIYNAAVYQDGLCIIPDAFAHLEEHSGDLNMEKVVYKFSITSERGILGKLFANKKLTDLNYGGLISWDGANSRQFADELMHGQAHFEHTDKIAFAPIKIYDYIDSTREDYNLETLQKDIVNGIVQNVNYVNGWQMGAYQEANATQIANDSMPEHADYRTVPFVKLVWLIKQIFKEFGYTIDSDLFVNADFAAIHLYNNYSIEQYNYPYFIDANNSINLKNHLPSIPLVDFLLAIKKTFNLKFTYSNKDIYISKNIDILKQVFTDFTDKALVKYTNAMRTDYNKDGALFAWEFGQEDQLPQEVVQDKIIEIITSFASVNDIANYTFTALTSESYIFIINENYYYRYDTNLSNWRPFAEAQHSYTLGNGNNKIDLAIAPLCSIYETDIANNTNWLDLLGTRQTGSYQTNTFKRVNTSFDLRMFFIKKLDLGNATGIPKAFTHSTDKFGNKRSALSLSLSAADGIIKTFWKQWLDMLNNGTKLSISLYNVNNRIPDSFSINYQRFLLESYDLDLDTNTADVDCITVL